MKKLIIFLAVLALAFIFAGLLNAGLNKRERVQCHKWKRLDNQYEDFYYTDWQKAQCGRLGLSPTGTE